MPRRIHVALLPELIDPGFQPEVAVVIDVLRATTTIATALANGASAVIPVSTVDEARQAAAALPAGTVLLGGERGGVRIDGFDLDNSPASYGPGVVRNKQIVFTTTNGTRALLAVRKARCILAGGFVNFAATTDVLLANRGDVAIVCAGTDGRVSMEDVLCAGALVDRMIAASGCEVRWDDVAELAAMAFRQVADSPERFLSALHQSHGGSNLVALGLRDDIPRAAAWNAAPVVAEFSRSTGRVVVSNTTG
jgi:2-phosphosulfolactate phosphatase